MKDYTVNQVAKLAGVSVRTLHHYHDIGLLTPACIGENGYRYYGEAELLRLQQILFYREFGLSLSEVSALLDASDFDRMAALRAHRSRLREEVNRYRLLLRTIDRTIADIKGDGKMNVEKLYEGFSATKQDAYVEDLVTTLGEDARDQIVQGRSRYERRSGAAKKAAMQALADIEGALVARMQAGVAPGDPALDVLLERHQTWIGDMWGKACDASAYAGMADIYAAHPDFRARYESLGTGFTDYLCAAMRAYSARIA